MPIPAVQVFRPEWIMGGQRRGLGASLMWHALGIATAVASALRARLVVAEGEAGPASSFLSRFGFRAFDSDRRWRYMRMRPSRIVGEVCQAESLDLLIVLNSGVTRS